MITKLSWPEPDAKLITEDLKKVAKKDSKKGEWKDEWKPAKNSSRKKSNWNFNIALNWRVRIPKSRP